MKLTRFFRALLLATGAAMLAPAATAQVLDDIEIASEGDFALVRLKFTVPIRYIRHFPPERGEILNVFLQALTMDGFEEPGSEEHKRSPKSALVPSFTIAYTTSASCDMTRNPICMVIQFSRPVTYKIRTGEDNRSLLLYIPLAPAENRPPVSGG
jgi:hypothetical protein